MRQLPRLKAVNGLRKGALLPSRLSSAFNAAAPATQDDATVTDLFPGWEADQMVPVTVDGKKVMVPPGITVLQACEAAGVHVPRFCFHDKLSIAGNCRMCLVEMEKAKKPVASCAQPIMPGCVIKTNTPVVKTAREGVMEFLLLNHPLDCPICDQGGNCDLQDQAMNFGSDRGRGREPKSTVQDKYIGPVVKTVMTRCIQCTRCIRFSEEICGFPVLGTTGRGQKTEVGTYVDQHIDSELSGNLIDLCPVGALTSLPNAFMSRPWEVQNVESIDCTDAVGSSVTIDVRGNRIMNIKSRQHDDVNEEWIPDKVRFVWDGASKRRLDLPLARNEEGQFTELTWPDLLEMVATKIRSVDPSEVKGVAGNLADLEAMTVLKDFLNRLGSENLESRNDGIAQNPDVRSDYLFNSSINNIEHADAVLLVGTNPRMEAPMINSRIRKAVLNFGLDVFQAGPQVDLAYRNQTLGAGADVLKKLAEGKLKELDGYQSPIVIVGQQALRDEYGTVTHALDKLRTDERFSNEEWEGISVLQTAASRAGALDIGFVPNNGSAKVSPKVVILLGEDEAVEGVPDDAFVIYIGTHGDAGANRADVILPAASFVEKNGTYVNVEGRVQRTKAAISTLGSSRVDWQIVRALAEVSGVDLPYNNIEDVRARWRDVAPHLLTLDEPEDPGWTRPFVANGGIPAPTKKAFGRYYSNYYTTDPISRSSKVLAQCIEELPIATNSYLDQKTIATGLN